MIRVKPNFVAVAVVSMVLGICRLVPFCCKAHALILFFRFGP